MKAGLSNVAFGRLLGVGEAAVRKADKAGRIKRFADGSIDAEASRALWQAGTDPARTRARTGAITSTMSAPARIPETGAFPTPDAYRDRTDLPSDPFVRGALYAAHAAAYALPTATACAVQEVDGTASAAAEAYAIGRLEADLFVVGICEDLGLIPAGTSDAGPHAPKSFQGFDPGLTPIGLAA